MGSPHYLKGEKVCLRPLEMRDVDFMQELENDPRSWAVGNADAPYSREAIARYIKNEMLGLYVTRQRRMVIETNTEEKEKIGFVDAFDFEPENMNAFIGIYLNPEFRGRGYGSEALHLFVEYCMKHIGMKALAAHISIDNKVSLRIFEVEGFDWVGVLQKWKKTDGEWGDVVLMEKVSGEEESEEY